MKEKVLMLLACLWLGIGFSMAQAPNGVDGECAPSRWFMDE